MAFDFIDVLAALHSVDPDEVGLGDLAQPVRALVSGRAATPGLFEVLAILGKDTVVRRLGKAEPIGRIETLSPDDFDRVIDVNLKGVVNGLAAALPRMTARGSSVIVNISSGAATNVLEGEMRLSGSA